MGAPGPFTVSRGKYLRGRPNLSHAGGTIPAAPERSVASGVQYPQPAPRGHFRVKATKEAKRIRPRYAVEIWIASLAATHGDAGATR